ncbi:hypothetical protein DJ72_06310 [Halorubrum distributum]|nr:hypothetical protein DJ72_06310 [Halorubrum distributum]
MAIDRSTFRFASRRNPSNSSALGPTSPSRKRSPASLNTLVSFSSASEYRTTTVQSALRSEFNASRIRVVDGDVSEFVRAAAEAEEGDDLDAALGYVVQAGTRVIDGEALDIELVEDLEYGLVSEWVNGLDSLQSAIEDPEVVEEED